MINRLDSHTHTIASGHAYNTIMEMVSHAAKTGLELLAITEHSVKMPGTCHELYFMNLKTLPRRFGDLEVLFGAELNIMDYNGSVDMKASLLPRMDVCVASLHTPCISPGSVSENTNALIGAMQNPYVHIIGHPDDGRYPVDYDMLVAAAAEYKVLLEVNNHSLHPKSSRQNARENLKIMLERCIHYGAPVILDSDAHWYSDIGNCCFTLPLLEEMHFPEELVVNRNTALYKTYIHYQGF